MVFWLKMYHQHHHSPGHGGCDNHPGNQYRNNTPNHFNHGGGGRSPGGCAPMYSPGFHTPQAPNLTHGFPHSGGQARGGVGGCRISQPGSG